MEEPHLSGGKTLTNGTTENTTVTFVDGVASFKLKGGETLKVKGLLMGTAYVITEADYRAEGYFTKMDRADSLNTETRPDHERRHDDATPMRR